MSNTLSKIKLNGVEFDIKDTFAREYILSHILPTPTENDIGKILIIDSNKEYKLVSLSELIPDLEE